MGVKYFKIDVETITGDEWSSYTVGGDKVLKIVQDWEDGGFYVWLKGGRGLWFPRERVICASFMEEDG